MHLRILDAATTIHHEKPTSPNKTNPLVTDAEVDQFVNSLTVPDEFEHDNDRHHLMSIINVEMKQISFKIL